MHLICLRGEQDELMQVISGGTPQTRVAKEGSSVSQGICSEPCVTFADSGLQPSGGNI